MSEEEERPVAESGAEMVKANSEDFRRVQSLINHFGDAVDAARNTEHFYLSDVLSALIIYAGHLDAYNDINTDTKIVLDVYNTGIISGTKKRKEEARNISMMYG